MGYSIIKGLQDFLRSFTRQMKVGKLEGKPLETVVDMKFNKTLDILTKHANPEDLDTCLVGLTQEEQEIIKGGPNTYTFDIETSHNVAAIFDPKSFVGYKQVLDPWFMFSWAARELGSDTMLADALPAHARYTLDHTDDKPLCETLLEIFDAADWLVGHNIARFDVPKFYSRCAVHGLTLPEPPKLIDTLKIAKGSFCFTHNNLGALAKAFLDGEDKNVHGGVDVWIRILEGKATEEDWKEIILYNGMDVELTERLYRKIRGFSKSSVHPCWTSFGDAFYNEDLVACKVCGSQDLTEGTRPSVTHSGLTATLQHRCNNCGHWNKEGGSGSNLISAKKRRNTLRTSN
jgi:hypothetical protein